MVGDPGPEVQSAILRRALVELRRDNDWTQQDIARALSWSTSKLIRIENGQNKISKTDLEALLRRYDVTSGEEQERLEAINQQAHEHGWWDEYRDQALPNYLRYIGYEAGASFVRQFPGTVVPGLLQTREYAEALTRISISDETRADEVVELRMRRQSELARRPVPPHQYYVLDEAAVRRHVGIEIDPAIMPNQLLYVADEASRDDRITVRIIPFIAGAHAALSGPFTMLSFDDLPDILYLDAGRGPLVIVNEDYGVVNEYRSHFESLLDRALPEDQSIEFIQNVAAEMTKP